MPTKYLYLIWSLYFVIIALWMFYSMPKYRKPMLILGFAIFWSGPFSEYYWMTADWWHPETITGTIIGIEDFIFSFAHVIIPIFIYKWVFEKEVAGDFNWAHLRIKDILKRLGLWFIVPFILAGILIQIFHVHSVIGVFIGMIMSGIIVVIQRKDLLRAALWSSLLMTLIALPAYLLLELLSPWYIAEMWYMSQLTGVVWLGIPIEDILWYMIFGFMMGWAYEYLFDFRFKR